MRYCAVMILLMMGLDFMKVRNVNTMWRSVIMDYIVLGHHNWLKLLTIISMLLKAMKMIIIVFKNKCVKIVTEACLNRCMVMKLMVVA